jgi:hypothetical protein
MHAYIHTLQIDPGKTKIHPDHGLAQTDVFYRTMNHGVMHIMDPFTFPVLSGQVHQSSIHSKEKNFWLMRNCYLELVGSQ